MANKYALPPYHPLVLVSYGVVAAGVLLFLSNFFLGPEVGQSHEEFRRGMDSGLARALGGMGLIVLGVVMRGVVEWAWNNSQPVVSVPARVVLKWTTTSGGGKSATTTHYHARFQTAAGEVLEFRLYLDMYKRFAERDAGTLTYQGSRVLNFG
ncbi:MAG: hypothetical protein C0501_06740 [Isosphaera sp.]|nr:hypothetical protein [Isosphaera sp.]